MTLGGFSTPNENGTRRSLASGAQHTRPTRFKRVRDRSEIDGSEITESEIDHSENAEPAGRGRGKHQSDAQPLEGVVVPVRVLAVNFFQVLKQVHIGAGPGHGWGWGWGSGALGLKLGLGL